MLPDSELARLQSDIENYTLIDTCTILAGTATPNGLGGESVTWGTVASDVKCRLDQKTGREQNAGGKVGWYTTNILSLPHDQTIEVGYRVVYASVTYTVSSLNEGSGLAVRRATLERV